MTFRIGQRVVCIDDAMRVWTRAPGWLTRFRPWERIGHNLNRGDIYTVTFIMLLRDIVSDDEVVCLNLAEAAHFGIHAGIGFPSWQFRPLIERKTDISVFTEMLKPVPAKPRETVRT